MTQQLRGTDAKFPLRDVVRQVTEDLAPEESYVLATLDGFSDSEALRRLTAKTGRDQRLAFGVDQTIMLISPVVWIGVDEAVRRIVDATADKVMHTRRRWWWPFSRRRKAEPATVVPALSAEQLDLVGRCVREAAQAARLSSDTGSRIADGVVRRLVIGPRTPEKAPSPDAP